jgi:acyl dehydratase
METNYGIMKKLVIKSYKEFEEFLGKEIGVSEYLTITQEQINRFAQATLDHQWIHTDPKRAKTESPFKDTIAHGYLTLSVLPYLWDQVVEFQNVRMLVNYGIENLRFNQPVVVDSRVRARVKLLSLADLRGITKAKLKITLEIEGSRKSAFDTVITFLYHFND